MGADEGNPTTTGPEAADVHRYITISQRHMHGLFIFAWHKETGLAFSLPVRTSAQQKGAP